MDFLTDWLTDWLKELLIGGIMGNLEGLFDYVNTQVGEIAVQVGTTPAAWNAGVFSLIRQLSETVILPIAGLVLTFVATYELIQMLLEKNNMHEFDVANIYKWIFKTACAIFILSNTFNIVMAVFDVSQTVIAQAGGLIQGSTDITPDMITELETTLEGMDLGPLLGLWLQSSIIGVTMWALGIVIFVLVYGRMLEIYCHPPCGGCGLKLDEGRNAFIWCSCHLLYGMCGLKRLSDVYLDASHLSFSVRKARLKHAMDEICW